MDRTPYDIKIDMADAWLVFANAKRDDNDEAANAALHLLIQLETELHTVNSSRVRPE